MRMEADAGARKRPCKHGMPPCETCVGHRRSSGIRRRKPELKDRLREDNLKWRKSLSPEREAALKAANAVRSKQWNEENRARARENNRLCLLRNPGRQLKYTQRWIEKNRDHVNARVRQRKAWKKGLQVGEVRFERIWERDGGICQICGVAIDRKDPDVMMRASMDHIITLAQRGAHCEENIDLAHRRCNYRKRNRSPWQLPPGFYWAGRPNRPGIFHISAFDKPEIACAST